MVKKFTYEYVKDDVEGRGYELLSNEYINGREKLIINCPEHGVFVTSYRSFRSTRYGCRRCGVKSMIENRAPVEYSDVKEKIESRGYRLLSSEYRSAKDKLKIECKKHGVFEMRWNNFRNGQGCPMCGRDKYRTSISDIRDIAKEEGYELISVEYSNNREKLDFLCPTHGEFKISWDNFYTGGHRCAKCGKYGFKQNEPSILYYIKIYYRGKYYYKIGITNRTVEERYTNDELDRITILKTWDYKTGAEAKDREQKILKKYPNYLYNGKAKVIKIGMTEVFVKDVLGRDR